MVDENGRTTFRPETTLGDMNTLVQDNQQAAMHEYDDARTSLDEEIKGLWRVGARELIATAVEESENDTVVPTCSPRDYGPKIDKWVVLINLYYSMLKTIQEEVAAIRSEMKSRMEEFEEHYRDVDRLIHTPPYEIPKRSRDVIEAEELLASPPLIDERYFTLRRSPGRQPARSSDYYAYSERYRESAQAYKQKSTTLQVHIDAYDETYTDALHRQERIEEEQREWAEDSITDGRACHSIRSVVASWVDKACRQDYYKLESYAERVREVRDMVEHHAGNLAHLKSRLDEEAPDIEDQEKDPDSYSEELAESSQ